MIVKSRRKGPEGLPGHWGIGVQVQLSVLPACPALLCFFTITGRKPCLALDPRDLALKLLFWRKWCVRPSASAHAALASLGTTEPLKARPAGQGVFSYKQASAVATRQQVGSEARRVTRKLLGAGARRAAQRWLGEGADAILFRAALGAKQSDRQPLPVLNASGRGKEGAAGWLRLFPSSSSSSRDSASRVALRSLLWLRPSPSSSPARPPRLSPLLPSICFVWRLRERDGGA